MPTLTIPDPAAAETIAAAWYTTRVSLMRRGSLTTWKHLAAEDRAALIATAEQLLSRGIILASAAAAPQDDGGGRVDLERLEELFAAASALPWGAGTQVPRNLYAGREPGVARSGYDIGRLDRAEDVAAVVEWVNAWPAVAGELRELRADADLR